MVTDVKAIGFIGLGNAGYYLAANLPRSGFNLVVRDADHARAQKFVDENTNSIIASKNDRDAWEEVDVLITMLPNGKIVHDVLLGETGIAKHLKSGMIFSTQNKNRTERETLESS
jgi:3-hydroxyisobutyrate dehydrogenase-like beta-hydroxyacid dehydrogenase